jgi:hypothetical protein
VCAVSYREVERAVHRLEGRRTVLSLEPTTLSTILESVRQVGWAAGVAERADALADDLRARLDAVAAATADDAVAPRLLTLEWLAPPRRGSEPELCSHIPLTMTVAQGPLPRQAPCAQNDS